MNKETVEMLQRLTDVSGVPGYESEVSEVIRKELAGLAAFSYDKLGSIICEKKGTSAEPKIMLPGHMDEVGFMVTRITEEGFIKFTMLGGWLTQYMLAQRVIIKTDKGDIPGIIGAKPIHIMTEEERKKVPDKKDLFIDIGARDEKDAAKIGVRPGDPIIPVAPFTQMANPDYLLAKAWDDRLGCALFIDVIKALKGKKHPNTVYGVGTVQEEVGTRGAHTSVRKINPDVALVCEVGIAQDVPGGEKNLGALGKGPQITIYDRGMIPNLGLRDFIIDTAEKNKIPYQTQALEGGATDGGPIHLSAQGVPCIYLGVPTRYIHCHSGIIHKGDYDNTVRLITEVVLKLDAKTVGRFTK
ncbi:MAG: M42 family metallopeptidase [Planctomycetes bacterium]|nr:M42 family metallopeptidase [Planctomycetota bacterium]